MVVWILISSLVINVAFYHCCIREEKEKDSDLVYTDPEIVVTRAGTPLSVTPASLSVSSGDSTTTAVSSPDSLSPPLPDFVLVEGDDEDEETETHSLLFTKDLIQAPKTQ